MRMSPDFASRNVASQAADPSSTLSLYRRLIRLRRAVPALSGGSQETVDLGVGDVIAWRRDGSDGTAALVVMDFADEGREVVLPRPSGGGSWTTALSTHEPARVPDGSGRLVLRPCEAVVLVDARIAATLDEGGAPA